MSATILTAITMVMAVIFMRCITEVVTDDATA